MGDDQPYASVVSIKGFNKDLKCRGFQFEVGKAYSVEGAIKACNNGFHAVDVSDPLHVWDFYPVVADDGTMSRYAEVIQSGAMDLEVTEAGAKIASANISVSVEISLPEFIRRAVDALMSKAKPASGDYSNLAASGGYSKLAASGGYSKLAASGDYSKLAASGGYSNLAASGDSSKLAASGDYSKLAASGGYSNLAASGDSSKLAASGGYSNLAASGGYSNLAASGDSSNLAASGDYSNLAASGKNCVIAASGPWCSASGPVGTHIALAEYDNNGECVGFATGCVGADGIEPNVAYVAKGGKLVRA